MKWGENFLLPIIVQLKGKIRLILYNKIQMKNLLKNLSHIAPVSPATQKHQFLGYKNSRLAQNKKNFKGNLLRSLVNFLAEGIMPQKKIGPDKTRAVARLTLSG